MAAAVALGGCGSAHDLAAGTRGVEAPASTYSGQTASSAPTQTTAGKPASPKPSGSPRHSVTETGKAKAPLGPPAKAYKPVIRHGKMPHPTIHAASEKFNRAVKYSDRVEVAVVGIHQGTESGYGPGVFMGAPTTQLKITLTNGTKKAINLQEVVVQMTFGNPAKLASPVYGGAAKDFSGTVKPGATAHATYVFSVPVAQLHHATMTVDFDGTHTAATFTGSLKK